MENEWYLPDSEAMDAFGARLATCCPADCRIYLHGDLGAGKTSLVRGFLHGLGHSGPVRSPTYTLVESYDLAGRTIYHFDLYRLGDPEELEYMGIRDYLEEGAVCLVEWPQQGAGILPTPDIAIHISYKLPGRVIRLEAESREGKEVIACMTK